MHNFHKLSKPELDYLRENCNFTTDEEKLLDMASKRMSDIQIADKLNISTSTVTKRKKSLAIKITEYLRSNSNMIKVYINGTQVTKEEIAKIEITADDTKRVLLSKMTRQE
jgi:predicted metal-binding transcription factor (methanogenesis marker protein 9)